MHWSSLIALIFGWLLVRSGASAADKTFRSQGRDHAAWVEALVKALEDGTALDLAPGEGVDVTQAAGWPASRQLPGEALRAALLGAGVKPDPRGLRIRRLTSPEVRISPTSRFRTGCTSTPAPSNNPPIGNASQSPA